MPSNEQVPVLIIGGGIVGLSASLFLSHHNIPSVLVEKHATTSIHPRARSVNARTMELFRHLGIEDRVREAGASMSASMGMYNGPSLREVIEPLPRKDGPRKFPFAALMSGISPVSGPFVTQDKLEPVLLEAAREKRGEVRFGVECVGVDQDKDGVTATLKHRESGEVEVLRTDYLIAADGANSPVRRQLNVPTTGRGTMGHMLNILFHADLRSLVEGREFSICMVEGQEVSGLFTSINNTDRWVFHMLYDPTKGQSAEDFTAKRCEDLLRIALGLPDVDIDVKSILPWEPSVRVAEKLQHGRIFLAGDAAHQMPPWAGQGANSGISDVYNLAWKLAAVLKGEASKELIETYDDERLPVGRAAAEASANAADERGVILTKRNLKFVVSILSRVQILSGHGYHYSSKAVCREDTSPLGGLTWRPWTVPSLFLAIDGRPGSRVPHLNVTHKSKQISTLDVCGKSFVLLVGADGTSWLDTAQKVSASLGVNIQAYTVGTQGDLVSPRGIFEAAAGISSRGALLVRPDDFIGWRERGRCSNPEQALLQAVEEILCLG
jgi:putative polyketide hydroxylase